MTERRIGNAESEVASPQVSMLFKLDCSTVLIVSCLINGSCRKYKVMLKSCWTPMQEVLNWFVWLPCFQGLSFLLFFRVIYSFCRVLKMRIHFEYLTPKHFDFAFPTVFFPTKHSQLADFKKLQYILIFVFWRRVEAWWWGWFRITTFTPPSSSSVPK